MGLSDFIRSRAIVLALESRDAEGVIRELAEALAAGSDGETIDVEEVVRAVMEREKTGSTGLGGGVAVPHAVIEDLSAVRGAFGRCAEGVDFRAVDGNPVTLFFLILAPQRDRVAYLRSLSWTVQALQHPKFANFLWRARTVGQIEEIFHEAEGIEHV